MTNRVLNIAHRGGANLRPENTLLAFEHARSVGVDMLEMDVRSTFDGRVVVLHDETVDRTTDGTGKVGEMTLDEVKELDAGYAFTPGGETYPYRDRGVEIPTFEEVLDAFPELPLSVEPKGEDPAVGSMLDLLDSYDAVERTVAGAFLDETVAEIREREPEMTTGFGQDEIREFFSPPEDYSPPGDVLQVTPELVDTGFVERAREFGLDIHVWTVNEREEMERLVDLGVDGIITDDPGMLGNLLA